MALKVGDLYVSLTANTQKLQKELNGAAKKVEAFGRNLKGLGKDASEMSNLVTAAVAGAVAVAATQNAKVKREVDAVKNAGTALAVEVAKLALPVLKQMSDTVARIVAVFRSLTQEQKEMVTRFIEIAGAVTLLGTIAAKVAPAFKLIATAIQFVSFLIGALGTTILPLIGAIGALVAVAGLIREAWDENLGGIRDTVAKVWEWIVEKTAAVGDFVRNVAKEIGGAFQRALVKVARLWADLVRSLIDGAVKVAKALHVDSLVDVDGIAGFAKDIVAWIEQIPTDSGLSSLADDALSTLSRMRSGVEKIGADIRRSIGGIFSLPKAAPIAAPGAKTSGGGPIVSGAVVQGMSGGINAGQSFLYEMEKLAKATAKREADLAAAHARELSERLKIAQELEAQKKVAGAITLGSLAGLSKPLQARAKGEMSATKSEAVGAGSWSEATKILKEGLRGSLTVGATLSTWAKRMSGILVSAGTEMLGAVGGLVQAGMQGAEAGGVWGAVIAVILEIAKKTASAMKFLEVAANFVMKLAEMVEPLVRGIFDALTDVLAGILNAVGPLFTALQPLFDAIANALKNLLPVIDAIGYLLDAIAPILEVIGKIVGAIDQALAPLLQILVGVLKLVSTVIMGIIIAMNEIAAAFGDTKARAEADRLKALVDRMWAPNQQAMDDAARQNTRATIENARAQDDAAQSANRLASSMLNAASGYKVNLARFNATDTSASLTMGSAGLSSGGGTTIIGDTYVSIEAADNPEQTWQQMQAAQRRENTRRGRSSGNPGSDW